MIIRHFQLNKRPKFFTFLAVNKLETFLFFRCLFTFLALLLFRGSGDNRSTVSYDNYEVYTKQKLVVHSGPSLPPVVWC